MVKFSIKITRIKELVGASPLGPHQGVDQDPLAAPDPMALKKKIHPLNQNSWIRPRVL